MTRSSATLLSSQTRMGEHKPRHCWHVGDEGRTSNGFMNFGCETKRLLKRSIRASGTKPNSSRVLALVEVIHYSLLPLITTTSLIWHAQTFGSRPCRYMLVSRPQPVKV